MSNNEVRYNYSESVVLITGASGLLGRVISQCFASAGATLILHVSKRDKKIEDFAASLPGEHHIIEADLNKEEEIHQLFHGLTPKTGCPDILINNAGVQFISPLEDINGEDWDHMLKVNLKAPHLCVRELVKLMKITGTKKASVINIASIESESPTLLHSHYDASKGALVQYTKAAALELGPLGIRVNAISPGLIRRPGIEEQWPDGVNRYIASSPLSDLIDPESVAQAALFLASQGADAITGVNLRVDKGVGVTSGY